MSTRTTPTSTTPASTTPASTTPADSTSATEATTTDEAVPTTRPAIDVVLPVRWRTRRDPARGILVAARPSSPRRTAGSSVAPPPEIVVRAAPTPEDGLDSWRDRALAELAVLTEDFVLEDDDTFDLDGIRVRYHRFAHRLAAGPSVALGAAEVLSEQWCWWIDGTGVTLTGTVAREDYELYCDLFEDVAATLQVTGEITAELAPAPGHLAAERW